MNKKTILIGLGVLAVAGIGYYMWKKKNETTSGADESSNATGARYKDCCIERRQNGECTKWKRVHTLVPCPHTDTL
jgi:hypothetical protein